MADDQRRATAMRVRRLALVFVVGSLLGSAAPAAGQALQQRLLAESAEQLAAAAAAEGDARRGAVVFHQPALGCATCHTVADDPAGRETQKLGPHLGRLKGQPDTHDAALVRSILAPSDQIRAGYETVRVLTTSGQLIVGLKISSPPDGDVVLRDVATQQPITIAAEDVDQRLPADVSIMPQDTVNQLAGRQQFLDLVKYLMEIRDGGSQRAQELQPPPELFAAQIPAYESHVDHAGLLRALDDDALQRGEAIYSRLCVNCHGTLQEPGSLPTAPRFGSGTLRNGHDPFAMYQTLTHGFGLMVPQNWMVPQQKYDVIHYIRETFFKPHNRSQYRPLSNDYLASLPSGDTFGPEPIEAAPWSDMDYGPWMFNTIEVGQDGSNIAYKGLAVRLDRGPGGVARGNQWMLFDHDTMRIAGGWSHSDDAASRFVDWRGIHFDGRHQVHPHVVGDVLFANPTGPGWANPASGSFADDQRIVGRDGKRYGPLPKAWAQYHGMAQAGRDVIVSYRIGDMEVLESFGLLTDVAADPIPTPTAQTVDEVFARTLHLQPTGQTQTLLVATARTDDCQLQPIDGQSVLFAPADDGSSAADASPPGKSSTHRLLAGVAGETAGCRFTQQQHRLCLQISPSDQPRTLVVWMTRPPRPSDEASESDTRTLDRQRETIRAASGRLLQAPPLADRIRRPAQPLWPETLTTNAQRGTTSADGFAIDVLTAPESNPWFARLRFGGHDFFDDGDRMAVCSWDGDVFEVSGLSGLDAAARAAPLTWRRIASGLFQPLGVKIVDGDIYLTCRDQIVVLRDRNRDGATDFYECFNNDQQVTEHFHEFAMGLQRDRDGNFYYAKSARHALPALVPHHGTLLRVSPDGARTDILAVGFRAANGVCVNPDGTFIVTDQEGHWNPKNRINWVTEGGFYGNMYGYHDITDASDAAMQQPLCWITNAFDRSPAELLWADSPRWGNLQGALLNLSYGYGKVYVVPHEHLSQPGSVQGAMCELPIPQFPTGIMRGRFHPGDGQLYVCGLFAWAGSQQTKEGGLYRIRYDGQGATVPTAVHAHQGQLAVTFSDPLSETAAADVQRFSLQAWDLRRSKNYGSPHLNERPWHIAAAALSADRKTVTLTVPELAATWCYELRCRLETASGQPVERILHGTIHQLAP